MSHDFFGLEVGATLIYQASVYDSEETPSNYSDILTRKVLSQYSPGIFKTGEKVSSDSTFIYGDYIEVNADGNYYERGDWEPGYDPYWYDPPYDIIVSNPLSIGSKSDWWGEVIRQETVSVSAVTYNAWVFRYYDSWTNESGVRVDEDYTYYVPNLGVVKREALSTLNGKNIFSLTLSLSSYSFGASKSSLDKNNVNSRVSPFSTSSKILKRLFKSNR